MSPLIKGGERGEGYLISVTNQKNWVYISLVKNKHRIEV